MAIYFPQSKRHQISDAKFVAAWYLWFQRFGPSGSDPGTDFMPILCEHVALSEQLRRHRHFSLDVMCRILSPDQDTAQATLPFRVANQHMIECNRFMRLPSGRSVKAARLTTPSRLMLRYIEEEELQGEIRQLEKLLKDVGPMGLDSDKVRSNRE